MRCYYDDGYYYKVPDGHPFPMQKFREAYELLRPEAKQLGLEFGDVEPVPNTTLEYIHEPGYLGKLKVGGLNEEEVHRLGLPWRYGLFERSRLETSGTVLAARDALVEGIACNLAGGTHHAFPDRGLGYCVLNDVAVASKDLLRDNPSLRIMVIDTDAHQGNGTASIFQGDERVYTYSIHGEKNYPSQKEESNYDVGLPRWITGEDYLKALRGSLPEAVRQAAPDMVFWIAGSDPHIHDQFGQMGLSDEQMTTRDQYVLEWLCTRQHKPGICVLYGGGYNKKDGHTAWLHANTVRQAAIFAQQVNAV